MKLATLLVLGVAASLAPAQRVCAQPVPAAEVAPAGAAETVAAWLGVATWPVSAAQSQALKLTEGFHLSVLEVSPESPAALAGLKAGDILLRLDDQILVNPAQLRSLIRSRKPGEAVKVALVRGGVEQTLTIPLGSKVLKDGEAAAHTPSAVDLMELLSRSADLPDLEDHVRILDAEELAKGAEGTAPGFATIARSDETGTIHLSRNESGTNLRCVDTKGNVIYQGPLNTPEDRAKVPADWLAKADGLGAGIKVVSKAPVRRRVILPGSPAPALSLQNTDASGTLTLTLNQGSKIIRCADPMGKVVFEGPINTAEERAKVPPEWLRRADALHSPIQAPAGAEAIRRIAKFPEAPAQQPSAVTVSIHVDEADGVSMSLRQENGARTLRATDASGAVLFDGPVDTEAQRAQLPEKVRARLGEFERRQQGVGVPVVPEGK